MTFQDVWDSVVRVSSLVANLAMLVAIYYLHKRLTRLEEEVARNRVRSIRAPKEAAEQFGGRA